MKKILTCLLAASIAGVMLVGCGEGKSVQKVNEDMAAVTEAETPAKETPAETAKPPVETVKPSAKTTEPHAETEEPEVAKEDFLTKNGFTITPQGEHMLLLTPRGSDEVEEMKTKATVSTVDSEKEGYVDTTAVFEITVTNSLSWWVTAFDRYTGTCYESRLQLFSASGSSGSEEVCVIDVDGKQYDCAMVFNYTDGPITTLSITVRHPKEYDGAVFQLGTFTSAQKAAAEAIDYSKAFTVDQYPVLLEGQYFFTATDN